MPASDIKDLIVERLHKSIRFSKIPKINKKERSDLSFDGAGKGTRTPDLLITNQLLYQLSHTSNNAY